MSHSAHRGTFNRSHQLQQQIYYGRFVFLPQFVLYVNNFKKKGDNTGAAIEIGVIPEHHWMNSLSLGPSEVIGS